MERRNRPQPGTPPLVSKGVALPVDYLKMVTEIFSTHFDAPLKLLVKNKRKARFSATGTIYPNEVLLSVSLIEEGVLSSTTAHASADFDPTANAPTAEELLASCVDALATAFAELLPEKKPEQILTLAETPLSAFEDIPFVWTPLTVNKRQIFLLVDKSNPDIEQMTEKWLAENDPNYLDEGEREQKSDEELLELRLQSGKGKKKNEPTRH